MHLLKATELYTLNWLIFYYVNFTSVRQKEKDQCGKNGKAHITGSFDPSSYQQAQLRLQELAAQSYPTQALLSGSLGEPGSCSQKAVAELSLPTLPSPRTAINN